MPIDRRELMLGAAASAWIMPQTVLAATTGHSAKPFPLAAIRLRPSDYATAVEVNRLYLHRLSPDRLLHNFRKYAGLEPKAELYGGWESDTIAGHTLGHYLTALVQTWEQTGDGEMRQRADYIVTELAEAQAKRGTGYVGALGRKRKDGTIVDGEEIFPEIMKGQIKSGGFDLNGAWSPLYTVHKLFAGLLDVHAGWGNAQAMTLLVGLAGYFERVFAALDDAQTQEVLGCEYGGLNESYAELYARTGDRRWLAMARKLYDRRVLDPLAAREDKLANFHANTQVPKLIGLARLYELTGAEKDRTAATFFWERVTGHHSYVIGGNADREYFTAPDTIAQHITEQTCEHCNTYNMLKLTRHLYGWQPDGALFDYYERAHLNHVMSAQDPSTGGFTYMTPLMTGAPREYSTVKDDAFWCCVGSGMESHAKHGESIFWEDDAGGLIVNLYIPADADWARRKAKLTLDTRYPFEPESRLTFTRVKAGRFPVALRVPGWAAGKAAVTVNGSAVTPVFQRGYAIIDRRWIAGDTVAITLPLELRIEEASGDADTIAILRGPMVMAADLGPASVKWDKADPALVGSDLLAAFTPAATPGRYATRGIGRPADLEFVPFYKQYQRQSAVYFKRFSDAAWVRQEAAFTAEQARLKDIAARSVDTMFLGEMQPERDHGLTSEISYPVAYRGRNGRDARSGGYFEFAMKTKPGPLVLQATYWGDERSRTFDILVDNVKVATQTLNADKPGQFFDVDYPLPEGLTRGKAQVKVRFLPHDRSSAGPVFGVRLYTVKPGVTV
ncbi:glycoside hydrolase family 127 protein [Microvirga sp. SRT01]|uniref:Glycoside hydrolase family 127 protein n=1 Tax=Sphingomonas longa TaxID=2778730 RepID=A0ABS2D6K8_9SPHN|nr:MULTISPECIES: glycoside hydrolase family 127 protein [Alphaproteobacteria]MBM6576557.1 glycoside hydrolase family 127 protein [Sphingomonas sp. BT552]MBR7709603.1 glycoside hydrolase family 127 protein [Microvirga sp. SRT01]